MDVGWHIHSLLPTRPVRVTLIYGLRYVRLLKMISPGGRSVGFVYVPARQGFVPTSSVAAGGGPPVDMFFDLDELRVGRASAVDIFEILASPKSCFWDLACVLFSEA